MVNVLTRWRDASRICHDGRRVELVELALGCPVFNIDACSGKMNTVKF
ncbi:hypothetical protein [Saccharothrix longispora]|nr:hypothetical protein [Saccharothrix longispora]MBY8852184.1 hypothetical protein [Saccharothrix sp. MB29]MDU0291827.1 hypothetical protein [Saccharothrix longispora]